MRRLAQLLRLRLEEPNVSVETLGTTTHLLLQLEGNEEQILKEYLTRRRKSMLDILNQFPFPSARDELPMQEDELAEYKLFIADDAVVGDPAAQDLSSAASDVHALGARFMPHLVQLQRAWISLSTSELSDANVLGSNAQQLSPKDKAGLLLDVVQELAGVYIDMCRRRLLDEVLNPTELVLGLKHVMLSLEDMEMLVPHAKLKQRASHMAEDLGKRELDRQLRVLQSELSATVVALQGDDLGPSLNEMLQGVAERLSSLTQSTLVRTAPLLVPLGEVLSIRPDSMARHMVVRLHASLVEMAHVARQPTCQPSDMLLRAGLCLHMVGSGVAQVAASPPCGTGRRFMSLSFAKDPALFPSCFYTGVSHHQGAALSARAGRGGVRL